MILQTKISNGQWTHQIILERFIIIKRGKNIKNILTNQNKKILVKKAIETAAWSEGKEASGIWFKIIFEAPDKAVSGLSKCTNCWIIIFIKTAKTTE